MRVVFFVVCLLWSRWSRKVITQSFWSKPPTQRIRASTRVAPPTRPVKWSRLRTWPCTVSPKNKQNKYPQNKNQNNNNYNSPWHTRSHAYSYSEKKKQTNILSFEKWIFKFPLSWFCSPSEDVADGQGERWRCECVWNSWGKKFLKIMCHKKKYQTTQKNARFCFVLFLKFSRYYAEPAPDIKKKENKISKKCSLFLWYTQTKDKEFCVKIYKLTTFKKS